MSKHFLARIKDRFGWIPAIGAVGGPAVGLATSSLITLAYLNSAEPPADYIPLVMGFVIATCLLCGAFFFVEPMMAEQLDKPKPSEIERAAKAAAEHFFGPRLLGARVTDGQTIAELLSVCFEKAIGDFYEALAHEVPANN